MNAKLSTDSRAVDPVHLSERLQEHLMETLHVTLFACVQRLIVLAQRDDNPIHTLHQMAHQMRLLITTTNHHGKQDDRKVALGILKTYGVSIVPTVNEDGKTTYTLRAKQGDLPL